MFTDKHTEADDDLDKKGDAAESMDVEDSTDGADETKGPPTKDAEQSGPDDAETSSADAETKTMEEEAAAGYMYVFKRRVPKVYTDDIFRRMDKEELEHWLTHRNVSCTLQRPVRLPI